MAAPEPQGRSRRKTLMRALAVLAIVVVVLLGGFYLTRYLVLRQYFVSVSPTGEIGIFQGVRGSFLGVSLNREIEGSCPPNTPGCEPITVNDLKQIARGTVTTGIIGLQSKQQAAGRDRAAAHRPGAAGLPGTRHDSDRLGGPADTDDDTQDTRPDHTGQADQDIHGGSTDRRRRRHDGPGHHTDD